MKKYILFSFIFLASLLRGQIVRINLDSLVEGTTIQSRKWNGSKDTVLVITTKTQQVYGDSTLGNVTVQISWQLDSTKAVKLRETQILAEKRAKRLQLQKDLEDFDRKNPDAKPTAKTATPKAILIETPKAIPKSYDTPSVKKRKWYQRKKQ